MERVVLRLMCDERGEISFLFGPWGAVERADAIRQIESGKRRYILQRPDGSRVPITVCGEGTSKRLTSVSLGAEVPRPGDAVRIGA